MDGRYVYEEQVAGYDKNGYTIKVYSGRAGRYYAELFHDGIFSGRVHGSTQGDVERQAEATTKVWSEARVTQAKGK